MSLSAFLTLEVVRAHELPPRRSRCGGAPSAPAYFSSTSARSRGTRSLPPPAYSSSTHSCFSPSNSKLRKPVKRPMPCSAWTTKSPGVRSRRSARTAASVRRARAGAGSEVTSARPQTTRAASGRAKPRASSPRTTPIRPGAGHPSATGSSASVSRWTRRGRLAGRGGDEDLREALADTAAQLVEERLRPAGEVQRRHGAQPRPRRAVLDGQLVDAVGAVERRQAGVRGGQPRLRHREQDLAAGERGLGVTEGGEDALHLGAHAVALAHHEAAAELPRVAVLDGPAEQPLPPLRRVAFEGGVGGAAAVVALEQRRQAGALVVRGLEQAQRRDRRGIERRAGALGRGVELAQRLDDVDVEDGTDEAIGGADVDHLPAQGELAGLLDDLDAAVAGGEQLAGQGARVEAHPGDEARGAGGQRGRLGQRVGKRAGRHHQDAHAALGEAEEGERRRGGRAERRDAAEVGTPAPRRGAPRPAARGRAARARRPARRRRGGWGRRPPRGRRRGSRRRPPPGPPGTPRRPRPVRPPGGARHGRGRPLAREAARSGSRSPPPALHPAGPRL